MSDPTPNLSSGGGRIVASGIVPDWLAAHDAAVRADQIEKDAVIAEQSDPGWYVSRSDGLTTAEAIRAQLLPKGQTDE